MSDAFVVVDTNVWVDAYKHGSDCLESLLERNRVRIHPLIVNELACGTPPNRLAFLAQFEKIAKARVATDQEVRAFIERQQVFGLGCGWADLSLLVSTLITDGAKLWTSDRRLNNLAERFGVKFSPSVH